MKRDEIPLREGVAAMMEMVASQRPDLLPIYLDMLANSPARFTVLELASDLGVQEPQDLYPVVIKISADLDRLERKRTGWRHPDQIVHEPNLGGMLYLCHARINNVAGISRRRRLEIIARKLQRVYDEEKTRAWIADFIGSPDQATDQNG